jgi:hypothetical protein
MKWLYWIRFAFDSYIELHEGEPVAELGQKVEAVGAKMLGQQQMSTEAVRREMAELRSEIRALARRLPAEKALKA